MMDTSSSSSSKGNYIHSSSKYTPSSTTASLTDDHHCDEYIMYSSSSSDYTETSATSFSSIEAESIHLCSTPWHSYLDAYNSSCSIPSEAKDDLHYHLQLPHSNARKDVMAAASASNEKIPLWQRRERAKQQQQQAWRQSKKCDDTSNVTSTTLQSSTIISDDQVINIDGNAHQHDRRSIGRDRHKQEKKRRKKGINKTGRATMTVV